MNNKINAECPHCGYVVTVSLFDLVPGRWLECPNCQGKIRFTTQDIQHLMGAVRHRK